MLSSIARNPRNLAVLFICSIAVLVGSVLLISPVQLPVILYKLALVLVAGVADFRLSLFPLLRSLWLSEQGLA